jgi:hypothetical protein
VQRDILGNAVMQNWQKRWPILLLYQNSSCSPENTMMISQLPQGWRLSQKTITYWDNIHEIVKKTPQKQFDGNQCVSSSHGKREKYSCGHKHQSVAHKASDHHLHHEWQQLAVITPH